MQVMVMNDDPAIQVRVAKGLRMQGFQVVGMETVARACDYVKCDPVDLLIMGERVAGRLSHTVALAAECANPMVTTIILTDRRDREVEELYDLLPSLYALVGPENAPAIIATIALAAIANPEDAEARIRRNALAREMQQKVAWDDPEAAPEPVDDFEFGLDAQASFYGDDPLEPNRETATWGSEEAVVRQAECVEALDVEARPARFSDIFAMAEPAEVEALEPVEAQAEVLVEAEAEVAVAAVPEVPVAVAPEVPVAAAPEMPKATHLPEVVPARQDRSAWMAAKVKELESGMPTRAGRLHLA